MATVSTCLNFSGKTEEAFLFYQKVFGGTFLNGGIQRFKDAPKQEGMPTFSEAEKNLVLHIELRTLGNHILMGTDAPQSMGFKITFGNNIYLNLETDTKEQTQQLFSLLSQKGTIIQPLEDMFWGAYYGSCIDQYGVQWMFHYMKK